MCSQAEILTTNANKSPQLILFIDMFDEYKYIFNICLGSKKIADTIVWSNWSPLHWCANCIVKTARTFRNLTMFVIAHNINKPNSSITGWHRRIGQISLLAGYVDCSWKCLQSLLVYFVIMEEALHHVHTTSIPALTLVWRQTVLHWYSKLRVWHKFLLLQV